MRGGNKCNSQVRDRGDGVSAPRPWKICRIHSFKAWQWQITWGRGGRGRRRSGPCSRSSPTKGESASYNPPRVSSDPPSFPLSIHRLETCIAPSHVRKTPLLQFSAQTACRRLPPHRYKSCVDGLESGKPSTQSPQGQEGGERVTSTTAIRISNPVPPR